MIQTIILNLWEVFFVCFRHTQDKERKKPKLNSCSILTQGVSNWVLSQYLLMWHSTNHRGDDLEMPQSFQILSSQLPQLSYSKEKQKKKRKKKPSTASHWGVMGLLNKASCVLHLDSFPINWVQKKLIYIMVSLKIVHTQITQFTDLHNLSITFNWVSQSYIQS